MNHKEILTKENIKKDLLNYPMPHIPLALASALLLIVLLCILLPYWFVIIILSVLEIWLITLLVKECIHHKHYRTAYKKEEYSVATDTLEALTITRFYMVFYFSSHKPLFMASYKRYYKWSKNYCLDENGMQMYSTKGDTFYIVTTDGKHPLMVYNTKLFEYKDES